MVALLCELRIQRRDLGIQDTELLFGFLQSTFDQWQTLGTRFGRGGSGAGGKRSGQIAGNGGEDDGKRGDNGDWIHKYSEVCGRFVGVVLTLTGFNGLGQFEPAEFQRIEFALECM